MQQQNTSYINSVDPTYNISLSDLPQLRELAITIVSTAMAEQLVFVNHPDSGRIAETVIQLLPEDKFNTLVTLVVGNETDLVVQNMAATFVARIAQKLGIELDNTDEFTSAVRGFLLLVNCENLRRKNQLNYLWPANIFKNSPKDMDFSKLTDIGKEMVYKQVLELLGEVKYKQ